MSKRNTWLLHPWLPVDIRLPAVIGVATMGTYLWLEQNGKVDEARQRLHEAKQASEETVASIVSSFKSMKLPSWMRITSDTSKSSPKADPDQSGMVLPNDAPVEAQEPGQPLGAQEQPQEDSKVVDVRKIDNLMQEALLGKEIPSPPETEPDAETSSAASETPWATVQRLVSQLESEKLSPEMMEMAQKTRAQVVVKDSTADAEGPGGAKLADHILHTSGVLGIKEDVSTSALLLHARRIGMGTSSAVADVVRQQAIVDSKELQSTLQKGTLLPKYSKSQIFKFYLNVVADVGEVPRDPTNTRYSPNESRMKSLFSTTTIAQHHSGAVAEAQAAAAYWKLQTEHGQMIADEVSKGVAQVLAEHRQAAEQDLKQSLKSKAQEMSEAFGRDVSEELKEQYGKIGQLGISLKSLQSSLASRKSEVEQCQLSYVLAGAAGSLHTALQHGCSTNEMVEVLDSVPSTDKFVACAKKSLSLCGTDRVASVKELQSRWPAVRHSVLIKANLHSGAHPGILSTLLSRTVAALKVSEWASVRVGAAGQTAHTLDVQLAAVDDAVAAGNLRDVATLLEELWKYSSVGHVADDFTVAVKARVVAEQALSMVHAHAFALGTMPEVSAAASGA